ncbi:MAG: hypothetical protein OEZ39_01345 [Gammaproteobacteria bacterium]|nr:hypothetical protein [Gammaproteobacteria bacterium]MDH5650497.1 hypothetical protein [Gammaproteobacteria bacterium]
MSRITITGLFLLIAGSSLISTPARANSLTVGNWSITEQERIVRYIVNGTLVHGHEFGFIKNRKDCSKDILWISFSSYDENVKKYVGQDALLRFQAGETKFQLALNYLTSFNFTNTLIVTAFTNLIASEKLVNLLQNSRQIEVSIAGPDELVKTFDIKQDTFNLQGFTAARDKAREICDRVQ